MQVKFRFQLTVSRLSQGKGKNSFEITSLRTVRGPPPSNARVGGKKKQTVVESAAAAAKTHSRGKEATERPRGERDVHHLGQASTSIVERQAISPSRPGHDPGDCPGRGETCQENGSLPACLMPPRSS